MSGEPLILPASFYDRPVLDVAPELLGCVLHHGHASGVIVETEAYHESEPACHAFGGHRPHLDVLFGAPGLAYVYRSYGIHALINAVCEPEGVGAAVLIRALEPLDGVGDMFGRRGPKITRDIQLCSGPGKLTQALGVGLDLNGTSLVDGPLLVTERVSAPATIESRRIGITRAVGLPWRFSIAGNRHVSSPKPS